MNFLQRKAEETKPFWAPQTRAELATQRWRFHFERWNNAPNPCIAKRTFVSRWYDDYFVAQATMYHLIYAKDGNTKRCDSSLYRHSFCNFGWESAPKEQAA